MVGIKKFPILFMDISELIPPFAIRGSLYRNHLWRLLQLLNRARVSHSLVTSHFHFVFDSIPFSGVFFFRSSFFQQNEIRREQQQWRGH